MAIETFNVLDILYYLGLLVGPPWLGSEKIFKIKFLRRLVKTIFRLVFANIVFQKRAFLLIF